MKRWTLALLCLVALHAVMRADNERPISITQLPAPAQQLIKKYFSGQKVALTKVEKSILDTGYDVIFTNGTKVEFDRHGNWTEIRCKGTSVPAALVPAAISRYIRSHYPDARIVKIEKERRKYDVELSNGVEVTFDTRFRVIDIDM